MLSWTIAGLGLSLIAAGFSLVLSSMRCAEKHAPASPSRPVNLSGQQLPVLSATQLFEHTGAAGLLTAIQSKCGLSVEHFHRRVLPVLHAYAEFVQQLPASESHHHAQPGGLLIHALEVADFALAFRRGQILPKGVAPEDILRLEHRWTYGVLVAALLHDIGKLIADLRVTLHGPGLKVPELWTPLSGSMAECGGTCYSVDFADRSQRDYPLHAKLPVFLFQRLIPGEALRWLSNDSVLIAELMAVLSGDKDCGSGEIKQLVMRADAESVKRNLLSGSRVRFSRARRVPLIERLMAALRSMLAEGGALPVNRSGGAGWVHDGHMWFVSKRLADEVRKYLQANESGDDGIPSDNQRLFDTWQEYGAVVSNPQTGGAVWNVVIEGEGYTHALTVLRFPLGVLYASANAYPSEMRGRVVVVGKSVKESASVSQAARAPNTAIDAPGTMNPHPVGENVPPGSSVIPASADRPKASLAQRGRDVGPGEQYLDDVEDVTADGQSSPCVHPVKSPAPKAEFRSPVRPAPLARNMQGDKEPPEAALRFMSWLQTGIADGTLPFNQSGAMVHFVQEGMLLVSPRIFQHFASEFGEDGRGEASTSPGDKKHLGLGIQKQLLKAGWHLRREKGINILPYQVLRSGKPSAPISGVLIVNPERFVSPLPVPTPHVIRATDTSERARENAISA